MNDTYIVYLCLMIAIILVAGIAYFFKPEPTVTTNQP